MQVVNTGTITKKASGGKSIPANRILDNKREIIQPFADGSRTTSRGLFFSYFEMWVLSIVLYKAYFNEFGGILARK